MKKISRWFLWESIKQLVYICYTGGWIVGFMRGVSGFYPPDTEDIKDIEKADEIMNRFLERLKKHIK